MDNSGSLHGFGDFVQAPSNTSVDLGSGGMAYGSGDNSELSANDTARREERYDTPPASFVEAVSPTSSRKGGQLRAGSLGISLSAGRVNGCPSSNGLIVPRKLFPRLDSSDPTLAWEVPMNQIIRQPLPQASVPPIEESLRDAKRNISGGNTRISNNQFAFPIPAPVSILRSQPYGEVDFARHGQRLIGSDERDERNPYIRRADEIGPTHRIPGLGHLGDFLVPPGWKEGDEPIDPQAAQALYHTARREASHALTKSIEEAINLSADAQEKRDQERNKRRDTQLQLDHMVLEERIKIYEKHEERKRMRMRVQGAGLSEPRTPKSMVFSPPLPLQPPTSTSFPGYHGPVRTDAFLHSPRYVDGHGSQVGQQGGPHSQQYRTDPTSPECLEPSLITNSFESIFARYQATNTEILLRRDANERMLSSFLNRYGRHISNGPIPVSPTNRTQPTGSEVAPLAGVQTAYSPHTQTFHPSRTIRPPPYESPTQGTFPDVNVATRMRSWSGRPGHVVAGRDWTWDNNVVALQGDPGQGIPDEEPSRRLGQTNVERPLESADQFDQKQDEVLPKQKKQASQTGRPLLLESKADRRVKRASRAKVEKKKTWYHDQIAKANMPTSVISEEALEAGRRYGIHGVGNKKSAVQKPTTPKPKQQGGKRVRKPELDPSKGFALSNQAADMLIASGFVKESVAARTAVPALSTSLVANPGTVLTGIPVSEHSLYVPGPGPRPNQVSSSQEISNAAASLQALAQDYGNSGNAPAATLAPTVTTPVTEGKAAASGWLDDDTEEESSSRDNDDPNDASFGKRYTGRKKGNPQKSIGPARKRKSAGATTPAKRSRLSVDGGLGGAADVLCDTLEDTPL